MSFSRNRELSEVDPLDRSLSRRSSAADDIHDFGGTTTVPDIHLVKTRSRRGSSFIKPINNILGIKEEKDAAIDEEDEESEETREQTFNPAYLDEKTEEPSPTVVDSNEQYKLDPERKESMNTLNLPPSRAKGSLEPISDENSSDAKLSPELARTATTVSVKRKRNKQAFHKVALMFGRVYLIIICAFVGILSIYWGSLFERSSHLKNISYLVVIGEQESSSMKPLISETLVGLLNSTSASAVGHFTFFTNEEFQVIADKNNNTLEQEVYRQVHHQKYWAGFYVPENATLNYYTALSTLDTDFNTTVVEFIYETGRNPSAIPSYVVASIQKIEKSFASYASRYVTAPLIKTLSSTEQLNLVNNGSSLLTNLSFKYNDYRPMSKSIVTGPIQLGLLYLNVLSFHQFNFASATHELIRTKLRLRQYMVYHIITSQGAYLVIGLVYCLMTLAFQIPIDKTFGKSGFLVEWAFAFLTLSAAGGINENVALQIFARNKAYIGFWVVFFMILNMACVFSPIALMNVFYRYGYAMPLYNCNELMKVVFLDTYKGHMARNIGVLLAWIGLTNIILPFNLKATKRYKLKVEAKARKAIEDASKAEQ